MSSELAAATTRTLDLTAFVTNSLRARPTGDQGTNVAEHHDSVYLQIGGTQMADGHILIVDDHPTNRMVMQRQIETLGYSVGSVESGAEAFELWRTGRVSLVLTDINMPRMSGYDLSRRIREAETELGVPRVPIIACTANVIPGVRENCVDAGIDDYIAKPTRLMTLSEKLARWLPHPPETVDTSASIQPAPVNTVGVSPVLRATREPRLGGGKEEEPHLSRSALGLFRQVNEKDVRHLLEAFERGDLSQVTHIAHRIRGACGFIGATALASVCGMIEQAGREGDAPGITWLMDAFRMELEQLNAILDA